MNEALEINPAEKAFSLQAPVFDSIDKDNDIIKWMRQRVYHHLDEFLKPDSRILELNCGTGIDAIHFASQGHKVVGTDISQAMLDQGEHKVRQLGLEAGISFQRCSYTALDQLNDGEFDHIFSNFGGLNCSNEIQTVFSSFRKLLKPGGKVTLVMLSPYCIWEFLFAFKLNFKLAFRRLHKDGVMAYVEDEPFKTYYFSGSKIRKLMRNNFELKSFESLGTFVPPPYLDQKFSRFPAILKFLSHLDEGLAKWPLIRSLGDHFIVTFQYQPQ